MVSTAKGTASALYLCCYYLGGSVGAVAPGLAWAGIAGTGKGGWGWPGVIALCLAMALVALAADAAMIRRGTPAVRPAARAGR